MNMFITAVSFKLAFRKKTNSSQISKLFALNNGLELQEDVRPRALG